MNGLIDRILDKGADLPTTKAGMELLRSLIIEYYSEGKVIEEVKEKEFNEMLEFLGIESIDFTESNPILKWAHENDARLIREGSCLYLEEGRLAEFLKSLEE